MFFLTMFNIEPVRHSNPMILTKCEIHMPAAWTNCAKVTHASNFAI